MEEELQKLREEAKTNEKLLKRYEAENQRLREATRFVDSFQGERRIDSELVAILKLGSTHDYRLLEILGIDPGDLIQIAAIQKHFESLELHGLVKKDGHGWRLRKK